MATRVKTTAQEQDKDEQQSQLKRKARFKQRSSTLERSQWSLYELGPAVSLHQFGPTTSSNQHSR